MPPLKEEELMSSLVNLQLLRDVHTSAVIERGKIDPVAYLLLRLVSKVSANNAAASSIRRDAKKVNEAKQKWEVASIARDNMIFLNSLGESAKVPVDLATALAAGDNLDASVESVERDGALFMSFAYGSNRVEVPSSLFRQLCLRRKAEFA